MVARRETCKNCAKCKVSTNVLYLVDGVCIWCLKREGKW